MKNPIALLLLALPAFCACAAAVDEEYSGGDYDAEAELVAAEHAETPEDAVEPGDTVEQEEESDTQALGSTRQALSIATGGFEAKPWCAARKTCYDQCDRDYPSGGGPLSTCKKICDATTASKCRPGVVGGGLVLY
jgi:hypothetical protein